MIRLLESVNDQDNSILQQVDDGAIMNYQIACQKDGAIFGCVLTNSTTQIAIGKGLLIVRGYRFSINTQTTILTISNTSYPASATKYYLWLRITHTTANASYEFVVSTNGTQLNKTAIEKDEGVYDYKLAEFTLGPSGISGTVKSLIANVPAPGSSVTNNSTTNNYYSIAGGETLPEPRIEIVKSAEGTEAKLGMVGGYLCIANKNDYSKYKSGYKIRFVLYRFMERGRYRNKRNGSKLYVEKTGYVKPLQMGWKESSKLKLVYSFNDLQTINVAKSGQYIYKRTDVLQPIRSFIDKCFYYKVSGTKTAVDDDTPISSIRSVRSKGNRHGYFRHNFIKIAFKAELLDSNNKKIAESGLSRSLTILVNYTSVNKQTTKLGEKFRVLIDL